MEPEHSVAGERSPSPRPRFCVLRAERAAALRLPHRTLIPFVGLHRHLPEAPPPDPVTLGVKVT